VTFDVERVRADFPALNAGAAHFDSPGGTQTPVQVADAISAALRQPMANRGARTPAERNADQIVLQARAAMGDLIGVDPTGIIFGRSATSLTFEMSRTLARSNGWGNGDEIVVTRLDHDANVRPWLLLAEAIGATVRFADFDPATGELHPEQIAAVLSDHTRVVAATAASNLIGTMPDVATIAGLAHQVGALLYLDGVHYAAHAHVDLVGLGADFMVCSPYKFFGPHLGVLAADPALLQTLTPAKLLPSSNVVPERFELGTLPYELLAGTTAAVDYLAAVSSPQGSRRERLRASHRLIEAHETQLRLEIETALRSSERITVYSNAARRTSTLLFSVRGVSPADVSDALAQQGVNAPAGSFYAIETSRHLGLADEGAVRAGITLYNTADDVHRLIAGLDQLSG
jgi:cysteine desulfurase family protein (TIGR01976 family)